MLNERLVVFVQTIKIFILLFMSIPFTSCNTFYEKELDKKNPTSYCFDANVQQVKDAIKKGLGKYQIPGLALYFKNDSTAISNITRVLEKVGNENDAYMETFLEPLKSKVYFKEDKPLLYSVEFHIHLDALGSNRTLVTIVTLNPEINTGVKPGIGDNLTVGATNSKSVSPSSIEEYEILLFIGNQLGQKGMPKCIYPAKDAKRKVRYNFIF